MKLQHHSERIVSLVRVADDRGSAVLRATVELQVGEFQAGSCVVCERATPDPDHAALEFVAELHDGQRLLFPGAENCRPGRDCWPVTGWWSTDEGLTCGDCAAALQEARREVRRKRRSP